VVVKMTLRVLCVLLGIVFFVGHPLLSYSATSTEIAQAINCGFSWLISNQGVDGSWKLPEGLEVQSTTAALDAIHSANITKGYSFSAARAWLNNTEAGSVDSLSRQPESVSKILRIGFPPPNGAKSRLVTLRSLKNGSLRAFRSSDL
jgi:hypothetical protein